jgi:ascorbate-specific PTS system EIIC-type component UlaA
MFLATHRSSLGAVTLFVASGFYIYVVTSRSARLKALTATGHHMCTQSGPKKCIHSLLINIFAINLNEISISG